MQWRMWRLFVWILFTNLTCDLTFLAKLVAGNAENDTLTVETNKGCVKGFLKNTTTQKTVRVFYGIPYAEPPVRQRRFQKPDEKENWTEVLEATIMPNSCVQIVDKAYGNFNGSLMWNANTNMSEDCLKLNVWTPYPNPQNLSVLVWIYGGGFYSGTSTLDVYDASALVAEENVIVVSMNYRVASLGFLSFGNDLVPGNAGLYDQLLALKWVKENIAAFGGDINRITLFGESAGAVSVGFHLFSPLSQGLFTRAILQSGYITAPWGFHDNATARRSAMALAKTFNCSEALNNDTLQCLLEKNASDIVQNETWWGGVVDFPFVPVQDGKLIPNSTEVLSSDVNFTSNTTVLLGSNANEGSYFLEYFLGLPANSTPPKVTVENFTAVIRALNPVMGEPPMNKVLEFYGNEIPNSSEGKLSVLDDIVGDYHFTCPVVQLADLLSKAGARVYQYMFGRRSSQNPWPQWMGVIHGEEIPFEFGEPFNKTKQYEEADKNLSAIVMQYWANFSKTGNPNCGEYGEESCNETWPVREGRNKTYLLLNTSIRVDRQYKTYDCGFWKIIQNNWTRPNDNNNQKKPQEFC